MAQPYTRDYNDYLTEIGDRVEFKSGGETLRGEVFGRGAAGNYHKILGDDGMMYEAYAGEGGFRKLFPGDES